MKFVILFVFICVGFVHSFPRKYLYPAIKNVYDAEVNDNSEDRILTTSISAYPYNYENDVNPERTLQEPCRLSLPTVDLSAIETPQDLCSDGDSQECLPTEVEPPKIPRVPNNIPFNSWTPYDFDHLAQELDNYRAAYNSYNMPNIYPNPVPPVRSLPPVISTHIHETIPEVPQIDDGFNMNELPESDIFFPPYVRAVRSRDGNFLDQLQKDAVIPNKLPTMPFADVNFLDQLRKDAVIPNILPTMPFPYMRTSAAVQANYETHDEGRPVGLFPPGSGLDCALPFLVSCSPKIYPGTLPQNVYDGNPIQSALGGYRKNGGSRLSHIKTTR